MKYLLVCVLALVPTVASAQQRALDRMQRQHEGMQQLQLELWLYRGGDWYMDDPVYGDSQQRLLRQLERERLLFQREHRLREPTPDYCDMTVRNVC